MSEKRALQILIAMAALLPVASGLCGVMQDMAGDDAWAASHRRYLSGLLLAIGLGYWSTVPQIAAVGGRLRLLTALVVAGGLARLLGLALGDAPTPAVMAALAMELAVAPLVCLWQCRVTARSGPGSPGIAELEPHLRHIER